MSRDVQDRIARNERSRVAIRPKAQVNEVQNRRRASNFGQSVAVAIGCGFQVGRFHGHRVDLFVAKVNTSKQTFAQVREVPVGVPGGGDAFVHLNEMHLVPRDVFARLRPAA